MKRSVKKIFFATTNQGKISEAREILGIEIDGVGLDIDEVQSLDPKEVAIKKALSYFDKLKRPILVEDTSLVFEGLGNLPGPFIDYFSKELGNDGLVDLLKNNKNRKAKAIVTAVYCDKHGKVHVFQGEVKGKIASKPKGDNGFGWDPIFIPNGSAKTFGEMDLSEKNNYSMRQIAFKKCKIWLEKGLA